MNENILETGWGFNIRRKTTSSNVDPLTSIKEDVSQSLERLADWMAKLYKSGTNAR